MAEITARQKQACPACGAAAEWNAAKQALVCPFCNTVLPPPLPREDGPAAENDLAAALRAVGDDQRGWQAEKTSVKCQSCQAISVFDPSRVGQRCEFCGSAALIPYDEIKAPIRPECLLEFKLPEPAVRDLVRRWYGGRWFAPSAMKARSLTDTVHGVYIPYWTFDAHVAADWTADAGYYYYVSESYTDSKGQSQTRQVRKTRWVPASGSIQHFFDDDLVPASRGVEEKLLRKIEPFPTTTDLKPYDPGFLSGWVVEQYQIDLIAAAQNSRNIMERKTRDLCSAEVPGDTQRNLNVASVFSGQTFKHILVPIWLVAYTYGAKTFQVVVNGYTGAIAGRHPLSWLKISLAVLAVLVVLIIVLTIYANSQ
ncbi:MAG TPA: zinc ribbon domain-containing protein [Chthoniobacterales bacterium]|nr:zinc ribbon domain-containing protein [Chthoniobacterales bacterium]